MARQQIEFSGEGVGANGFIGASSHFSWAASDRKLSINMSMSALGLTLWGLARADCGFSQKA